MRAIGRADGRRGPAADGGDTRGAAPGAARRRRGRAGGARGAARPRPPAGGRGGELPRHQAVRRGHGEGGGRACATRSTRLQARPAEGRDACASSTTSPQLVSAGARRRRPRGAAGRRSSSCSCCSLLLGDLRAALLVTLTIPLSVALAGLLLRQAGVGLNTMTLGGLAIAVGLLVDAAIIVAENVLHRTAGRARPAERRARALAAAVEVGRPIAFATLIVIAVFLPLFGMAGIEGRMYRPLAAAVVATVAAALVARAHAGAASSSALGARGRARDAEDTWLRAPRQDAPTRRSSTAACATPGRVRVVTLRLTVPALVLAFAIGRDFMPRLDEGAFLLQTMLPPEASLARGRPAEPPGRGRAAHVPRGGGRRAAHRPRRAHRGPDAAHGLRRAGRAEARSRRARSTALEDAMRAGAREGARRVRALHDAARACASTRGWAARPRTSRCASSGPTSTSWRGWPARRERVMGARARAGRPARGDGSRACRSCGSRSTARRRRASG